ncbi:MAG TPA: cupin domain-containing protein [Phototrophicaceae bacterium]|nr:cupin domain-containing protein [Phototrophicaceae bacterium]
MVYVVNKAELPSGVSASQFEGYLHEGVNVSFFLSHTLPGHGPGLHWHPYEEVFIVQSGKLTFTVGDVTIEATGGQIVIVQPEVPHKFINSGPEIACHVDIHVNTRMITTWLEK